MLLRTTTATAARSRTACNLTNGDPGSLDAVDHCSGASRDDPCLLQSHHPRVPSHLSCRGARQEAQGLRQAAARRRQDAPDESERAPLPRRAARLRRALRASSRTASRSGPHHISRRRRRVRAAAITRRLAADTDDLAGVTDQRPYRPTRSWPGRPARGPRSSPRGARCSATFCADRLEAPAHKSCDRVLRRSCGRDSRTTPPRPAPPPRRRRRAGHAAPGDARRRRRPSRRTSPTAT